VPAGGQLTNLSIAMLTFFFVQVGGGTGAVRGVRRGRGGCPDVREVYDNG